VSAAVVTLLTTILGWGTSFFNNRQQLGRAKTEAKIELQKAGATGWTGRILVLFWFYPAIACYLPFMRESAGAGFQLLMAQPEWYLGLLVTITATLLGIDKFQRLKR